MNTTCDPIIQKLLEKDITSVLIVGVHTGKEAQVFIDAGKQVTGIDILPPYRKGYTHVRGKFEELTLPQVDCALSSHTLEHMENVGVVIKKYQEVVKPGGWLGLVVPGYSQDLFHVGHYTLWSPALLLYNLVVNGWDCREAQYYTTQNKKHIGILVPNNKIQLNEKEKGFDVWEEVKQYLPVEFRHGMNTWLNDRWDYT